MPERWVLIVEGVGFDDDDSHFGPFTTEEGVARAVERAKRAHFRVRAYAAELYPVGYLTETLKIIVEGLEPNA